MFRSDVHSWRISVKRLSNISASLRHCFARQSRSRRNCSISGAKRSAIGSFRSTSFSLAADGAAAGSCCSWILNMASRRERTSACKECSIHSWTHTCGLDLFVASHFEWSRCDCLRTSLAPKRRQEFPRRTRSFPAPCSLRHSTCDVTK